ncbi:hypothetical protein C3L33_18512, partial [Rhododendron williamsianum]
MRKEEKRRKFHQSLLNLLYPPPPSPPLQKSGCSSSSDDEGECGPQKLTRAQRKRIRKKKVREAASRRRKLIGPVLPGDDDGSGDLSNESQGVVRNAAEKSDIGSAMPGTVSMSGLEVHILIWMHGIQDGTQKHEQMQRTEPPRLKQLRALAMLLDNATVCLDKSMASSG